MDLRRASIPFLGAANNSSFTDTPEGTNPPSLLRNFELYDTTAKRPRGGSRRGLIFASPQRLGSNPIQGMATVNRSPVSIASNLRDIGAGVSMPGNTLTGNAWVIDSIPSMDADYFLDTSSLHGPSNQNVIAAAWHPSSAYYAVGCNFTDSTNGLVKWLVKAVNLDGSVKFSQTGAGFINSMVFTPRCLYLFGDKAWQVKVTDGSITPVLGPYSNWAQEFIRGRTWTNPAGERYMFLAFNGTQDVGQGYVGSLPVTSENKIESGIFASHFRSGVCKLRLFDALVDDETFEQVQYGPVYNPAYPYREKVHGYFRVSERSICSPHGCAITDMDVSATGDVFVTRTNQGWGFNPAWRPTGSTRPYVSVFKIDADGNMAWESDTNSIRDPNGSGTYSGNPHYNDINDPTLRSVCANDGGDCFVGGQRNASGYCIFALSGPDGAILWAQDVVGGSLRIFDSCAATDPSDGFPVFVGDRSNAWPGSSGAYAHWWKLDPGTGDVVKVFDLNETVSAQCVAFAPSGECVYGTEYVA